MVPLMTCQRFSGVPPRVGGRTLLFVANTGTGSTLSSIHVLEQRLFNRESRREARGEPRRTGHGASRAEGSTS